MTDKLAEAIEYYEPLDMSENNHKRLIEILKAARTYNDLPVVDVDLIKYSGGLTPREMGWNMGIHRLKELYPNGLRWKND